MALSGWSTTAADNATVGSINWAEGQNPNTVNNSARQEMADVREFYENIEWRDWGHTPTRTADTTFTVTGDQTAVYTVGRRIQCTDSSTLYGTITASAYTTLTTVTVSLDSGNLSASLSAVALGLDPTNKPLSAPGVAVTDSGGYFTGADVEAILQEIAPQLVQVATTVLTFTNVGAASSGTAQNWSHGLGTDDIDFGYTIADDETISAGGITLIGAAALNSDMRWVISPTAGAGSVPTNPLTSAHKPATGIIRANVYNGSGTTTNVVRLLMWARKRA